jgi:predicted nucleotidyltransferase
MGMMKEREERKIIRKLAEVIAGAYKPEKIILFGSHAYGEPHEESDIDLLIIKKTRKAFFARLYDVRRISSEVRRGYAFEPVVLTPAEVNERLRAGDQFIDEILTKGEVLYARQQGIPLPF